MSPSSRVSAGKSATAPSSTRGKPRPKTEPICATCRAAGIRSRRASKDACSVAGTATCGVKAVDSGAAQRENDDILIDVIDNGIGLPKVARARLLEPYVTTRAKGTGLGLAIVGRVLEDHGGRIELKDASDFRPGQRGAWMRLRFAVSGHAPKGDAKEQASPTNQVTNQQTNGQGDENNPPDSETTERAATTNNEPKTEAATGD